jgi:hypothetical protein
MAMIVTTDWQNLGRRRTAIDLPQAEQLVFEAEFRKHGKT